MNKLGSSFLIIVTFVFATFVQEKFLADVAEENSYPIVVSHKKNIR